MLRESINYNPEKIPPLGYYRETAYIAPDGKDYTAKTFSIDFLLKNPQGFESYLHLLDIGSPGSSKDRVATWESNWAATTLKALNIVTLLYDTNGEILTTGAIWIPQKEPMVLENLRDSQAFVRLHGAVTKPEARGKGLGIISLRERLRALCDEGLCQQIRNVPEMHDFAQRLKNAKTYATCRYANLPFLWRVTDQDLSPFKLVDPSHIYNPEARITHMKIEGGAIFRVNEKTEPITVNKQPLLISETVEIVVLSQDLTPEDFLRCDSKRALIDALRMQYQELQIFDLSKESILPDIPRNVEDAKAYMQAVTYQELDAQAQEIRSRHQKGIIIMPTKRLFNAAFEKI